jgi:hypothetical protein
MWDLSFQAKNFFVTANPNGDCPKRDAYSLPKPAGWVPLLARRCTVAFIEWVNRAALVGREG